MGRIVRRLGDLGDEEMDTYLVDSIAGGTSKDGLSLLELTSGGVTICWSMSVEKTLGIIAGLKQNLADLKYKAN